MLKAPRRAPRLAGAHPRWRSTLALTFYEFTALSNSDRAPVFLFALCTRLLRDGPCPGTCLDQAGARFGLGHFRVLVLVDSEPAWRP